MRCQYPDQYTSMQIEEERILTILQLGFLLMQPRSCVLCKGGACDVNLVQPGE